MLVATVAILAALGLPAFVAACVTLRRAGARRERRRQALRLRLYRRVAETQSCADCGTELEPDYLCCPGCGVALRTPCGGCERPIPLAWSACPYCGSGRTHLAPVTGAQA